ncbi:hypothetical protein ES703_100171 [subsurface metagenome]
MISYETLLKNALRLRPVERAHLIERLMASLEKPDLEIESIWEQEAIRRYEAYKEKRVKTKDLEEVLRKYE